MSDPITRLLGEGAYSKVVQGQDQERKDFVAIKISNWHTRKGALLELRALATLKANDQENQISVSTFEITLSIMVTSA